MKATRIHQLSGALIAMQNVPFVQTFHKPSFEYLQAIDALEAAIKAEVLAYEAPPVVDHLL